MGILSAFILIILASSVQAADLNSILSGRGIWWDKPYDPIKTDWLQGTSIRRVHIMITETPDDNVKDCSDQEKSKVLAKKEKFFTLVKTLREETQKVIATVYLPPNREVINYLFDEKSGDERSGVVTALAKQGIDAIELDLEGPWIRHKACGYSSHEAAFEDFKTRAKILGLQTGITTHNAHFGDKNIPFAKADFLSLQIYSTTSKCPTFDDPTCGPGAGQKNHFKRMKKYQMPVVIGLAAYKQRWPKNSQQEGMALALKATKEIMAENVNVRGYSYWSRANLLNDWNAPIYEFIRNNKDQ